VSADASDLRARLQHTLSGSYTIERELGGGGMSRVFVAEEVRLKRQIVIKVLPPELAEGISVERFEREIRLVASLQHAHIVPVLATGEVDGLPWFTMPFIEGESLRQRVARGPLPIHECVSILRDVARALTYAHGRDVVHRDIKPDNVLLSSGSAVVMDFGIAKALSVSRTGVSTDHETLTRTGTSIGTPAYMAPEQAAGDPNVDARADIYAFGCTAYEILTGMPPFAGRTPQGMLAAHMAETPRSVRDVRPDVPAALGELVMGMLAKDAAHRPQSAAAIVRTLDTIPGSTTPAPTATLRRALLIYAAAVLAVAMVAQAAIVGIGLPDWVFPGALVVMALGLPAILVTAWVHRVNRLVNGATPAGSTVLAPVPTGTMTTIAVKALPYMGWRRTALAGIVAVAAFAIGVTGFMGLRAAGIGPAATLLSRGTLAATDRTVLGDLEDHSGDSTLAVSLVEALRADLDESRDVHLVEPAEVQIQLARMGRPANAPLLEPVARELAERAGAKAYIAGEVTKLGSGYVITARLADAESGTMLLTRREVAKAPDGLINAIDRISRGLRRGIGESLRHLHSAEPLEQVVTPSFDALRFYSAAMRANYQSDNDRTIPLLRAAVRADTGFAMAWRKLSVLTMNVGNHAEALAAAAATYRHLDRLSPYERYVTDGSIASRDGQPDYVAMVAGNRLALELKPGDPLALGNLGECLARLGRFAEAEQSFRLAVIAGAPWGTVWGGLVGALANQQKWRAADSVPPLLLARFGDSARTLGYQIDIARFQRNFPKVDSLIARYAALPMTAGRTRSLQALRREQAEYHGRLRAAEHAALAHAGLIGSIGGPQTVLNDLLLTARHDAIVRGRSDLVRAEVNAALQQVPLDSIRLADRPYYLLAEIAAYAGDRASVLRYRSGYATVRPANIPAARWSALEEIAAGHWQAAAAATSRACDTACHDSGLWYGTLLDRAGQGDSARRVYQRLVDAPILAIDADEETFYPIALLRLGELYRAAGDPVRARTYLTRFIDLWKSADPELQPMVARAREQLTKLGDVAAAAPFPQH
jgi:tRNA A-37 threonylcarbamoyl transferase component Bud32/tetratricopeptide (TPR) repeat protein